MREMLTVFGTTQANLVLNSIDCPVYTHLQRFGRLFVSYTSTNSTVHAAQFDVVPVAGAFGGAT
jgi:hypothetical protein